MAAERRAREQVSQLKAKLHNELAIALAEKSIHMESRTTQPPVPIDI
jgi:hypothetical protein